MDRRKFDTNGHNVGKKRLKEILETLSKHMPEMREKFGVKELGIFGSSARGKATLYRYLNVIVEFEEGKETFRNYMGLKFYLEDLFEVDVFLVTKSSVDPEKDQYILEYIIYV